MGMVNIKTPADTFCKQFFTIFYVIALRSKKLVNTYPNCFPYKILALSIQYFIII